MTKYSLCWSGIAAVAGMSLLAGCNSAPEPESTYAGDSKESIYRTVEKADSVYRSEQAECVALFDHIKDRTGFQGSMMHVVLKAGNSLTPWQAKDPQIIYTAKGTGMVKLNSTAFILQEGTGLYVPKDFQVEISNNSKADLKVMILCHNVPNLKWAAPEPPVTFQPAKTTAETLGKVDPKDNKMVNQLVPDNPGTFTPPDIQPQTLTPNEQKVNTLSQEGFTK